MSLGLKRQELIASFLSAAFSHHERRFLSIARSCEIGSSASEAVIFILVKPSEDKVKLGLPRETRTRIGLKDSVGSCRTKI